MDDALGILFTGLAESISAALAPLRDLAAPLRGLTDFVSASTGAVQNAADVFRRASSGNASGGTNKAPSTAGATQGQVERALADFDLQLKRTLLGLGSAASLMTPELDRVRQLFQQLQQQSGTLANGSNRGFVELQAAINQVGKIKVAEDVSKVGDQLLTAVGKARRAQAVGSGLDLSIFDKFSLALAAASKNLAAMLTNPLGALSKGLNAAATPTAKAAGGMSNALGGITSAVMGPLQGLAGAVGSFVQALNPSLMKLFNQALRDLSATFGTAFAPIIQHVSAVFNELSATLAPAMKALSPIIDNLMSVLEGSLVPIIGMIADAFVALSPLIEFVTSIMASMAEAMRVVYTVFRSAIQVLYEVIAQMFGGVDLKNAANGIREVLQTLTKYFVQFAAYVAKALGYLDPFAKALQKNLKDLEGKAPGVKAAPENVHVTGLEQLSKDMAVAAFNAQAAGGTRKKSEAEFLEELIKQVEEVKQNGKTLEDFLKDMQAKIVQGVLDDLSNLWGWFTEWWDRKGNEEKRHEQLEQQAREMRQRHGIAEPAKPDPTFWDNLWNQP